MAIAHTTQSRGQKATYRESFSLHSAIYVGIRLCNKYGNN